MGSPLPMIAQARKEGAHPEEPDININNKIYKNNTLVYTCFVCGRREEVGVGSTVASVRSATDGDVAMLVELSAALFREDAGTRDPSTNVGWPLEYGLGYFAGFVGREDGVCLIADTGGVTIGYLAGYVREPDALRPVKVAMLESMYVHEGARGTGVGGKLVRAFLDWAGKRGAERASVTAYSSNERAIRFYERLGFRPRSLALEMGLR